MLDENLCSHLARFCANSPRASMCSVASSSCFALSSFGKPYSMTALAACFHPALSWSILLSTLQYRLLCCCCHVSSYHNSLYLKLASMSEACSGVTDCFSLLCSMRSRYSSSRFQNTITSSTLERVILSWSSLRISHCSENSVEHNFSDYL